MSLLPKLVLALVLLLAVAVVGDYFAGWLLVYWLGLLALLFKYKAGRLRAAHAAPAEPGDPSHVLYETVRKRVARVKVYADKNIPLIPTQLNNLAATVTADAHQALMTDMTLIPLSANRVQPGVSQVFACQGKSGPINPFGTALVEKNHPNARRTIVAAIRPSHRTKSGSGFGTPARTTAKPAARSFDESVNSGKPLFHSTNAKGSAARAPSFA